MNQVALSATPGPELGAPEGLRLLEAGATERRAAVQRYSRRPLGEIMVESGLIDERGRDLVLERQAALGLPFGECCVRLNLTDASGLSRALAQQFGHPVPAGPLAKDLTTVAEPFGRFAEAMHAVAVRLQSRWLAPGRNALAVTSPASGEGRSWVAANLAVSFARLGARTILIDADLRRPRQHALFGIPQHPGLSRLLCGFGPEDLVHHVAGVDGLAVIAAGPVPPNPAELLGRGELRAFLAQVRDWYDLVIVDTPSAEGCADAEAIALATGSVLVVARRGRTRQRSLRRLVRSFADNGVEVAGTLMTTH